jgi:hypothetical protein
MKKQLVLRALTDPKFRKLLEENPIEAMEMAGIRGGFTTDANAILHAVGEVESTVSKIGEQILCSGGGGGCCGICLA